MLPVTLVHVTRSPYTVFRHLGSVSAIRQGNRDPITYL